MHDNDNGLRLHVCCYEVTQKYFAYITCAVKMSKDKKIGYQKMTEIMFCFRSTRMSNLYMWAM